MQVELADLRRGDVDVVGPRQVVVFGRAQEPEAIRQAFQHALGKDQAALFSLGLEDFENQFLFAQTGGAGNPHVLSHLVQLLDTHILERHQIQRGGSVLGALDGLLFPALARMHRFGDRRRVASLWLGTGSRGARQRSRR